MKSTDQKFCSDCGEIINIKAEICPKCGVRQINVINPETQEIKSKWITTLLLCWFLGVFGVHRFYTGHTLIGLIQLFTLGGCGIWALIDLVLIIVGSYKDSDGNILKNA